MHPEEDDTQSRLLPRWLGLRIAEGAAGALPAQWRSPGAAMFVDLVGFTPLTAKYASAGPEGAEQLRAVLDTYFGAILTEVEAWGGDVAAFAGDAVLVAFLDEHYPGDQGAVKAAIGCARAVQALATHGLAQRVSVSCGELLTLALATEGERGIGVLGGDAVRQLAVPHGAAEPGDVVLSAAAAAAAFPGSPERAPGAWRAGGVLALTAQPAPPRPAPTWPAPAVLSPAARRPWLPRVVCERGDAGQAAWVDEFRTATICFVTLPDGAADDPRLLQAEVQRRIAALARFEGDCLGVVIDEKGATLIGAFGLPGRAHEDDAVRAVQAALVMQESGASSIGIATGRLYAGMLGTPIRRDYGGLGPPMNLSARLMGKADGGLLVDAVTARAAGGRFDFESLADVRVKGVPDPVPVFRPMTATHELLAVPQQGREAEREDLLARLDAGSLRVAVLGEAGIGKSSMLAAVIEQALDRGVTVLRGEGGAIERFTSWHAWKPVLAALVGGRPAGTVLASLADADLAMRAALLDGIWPLTVPSNPIVAQMEPAARAATIRAIVVRLLEVAMDPKAGGGRVLVVLDDAHWLDTLSASLASEVLERLPALNVLIGSRPLPDSAHSDLTNLVTSKALTPIVLRAMTLGEVSGLTARALGLSAVPEELAAFVYARSGGHPFYGEQLVLTLRDAGVVKVVAGACSFDPSRATNTIPATVEGVVTARIDALQPGAQLTAKVASVIGRVFPQGTVQAVYPADSGAGAIAMVPTWLRQLSVQELILAEGTTDWAFKHAITQEVAYNLLPFAHRRDLHGRVAKWYAGSDAAGLDDARWPMLAWHWERAGEAPEALRALEQAAIGAAREHANTEVLLFLDRARALAVDLPQPAARQALWDAMAGTARLKLASYPESRAHFRSALARLGFGVPSSRLRLALDLLFGCGRLAVDLLLGVKRPDDAPVRARFRAVAEAHQGLAEVEFFSLDLLGLLHADVHAILAAARGGEPREIAIACASGAIGAGLGGLHRLGWRWNTEALEAARQSGHTPTLAYVNLLSAVFTSGLGFLDAAATANAEATRLFRQLGDRFRASSSLCGEAFNRLARGKLAEAREAVGQARILAPRHGALQVRVWCATVDVLLAGVTHGSAAGDDSALSAAVAELDALLLEEPHHAERILALGALAGGRHALGQDAAALADAREGVRLAVLAPPTNWFQLWSLADAVGVMVASADVPDREASRAVGTLRAFARMCPVAEPRAALAQSALAARRGRPAMALRYATAALTRAAALGMPWELALAKLAAGRPEGPAAMLTLRTADSPPGQAA